MDLVYCLWYIQIPSVYTSLDHLPKVASLISSSADHPMKNESQLNIHVLSRKSEVFTESSCESMRPKPNTRKNQIFTMCSSKEQSAAMCSKVLISHTFHVGHCVKYQVNTSKWWCPATITSLCSEKGTYRIIATNGAVYKEM